MLTGDNGILTRAGEAKTRTDEAQIIEEARMDILANQTSKMSGKINEKELKSILSKYGTLSTEESITDKKLTTTDGKYIIPVSKIYNGNVLEATIENTEPKSYYGDLIDYDVDIGVSLDDKDQYDWKIFYNDGTNIYIIAEDYVKMDRCPYLTVEETGREIDDSRPYSLYLNYNNGKIYNNKLGSESIFGNGISVSERTRYFANNYLIQWKTALGDNTSTNPNAKMVAILMDTNLWANFAASIKVSELTSYTEELSAIGGPTLEMWIKSWNEKYTKDQLFCDRANLDGYCVKADSSPLLDTDSGVNGSVMRAKTGYEDTLYYSHSLVNGEPDSFSTLTATWGYWLASPSVHGTTRTMRVVFDGSVSSNSCAGAGMGIRPVVCLPSDITATWNETDGVWNIIKK